MGIKRGLTVLITGTAIEAGAFWAIDYYAKLNLIQRIDWHNILLWEYFAAGFLTSCWLVLWSKFLNKIFAPKKKAASAAPYSQVNPNTPHPSNASKVMEPPARMNIQNSAVLSVSPTEAAPVGTINPVTPAAPSVAPVAPIAPTTSQKTQDIDMLSRLEPDLDMMSFKHVNLEGKNIDLVYSSDTNALLCAVFSEPHVWTINTSVDITESVWTDETGASSQPCLLLLHQAAALEKMEPDSVLTPTILLMRGSIQNAAEAIPYLKENHIIVATYQPSDMPGVPTIVDLLKEQFSVFPPSYDVITENMARADAATATPAPAEGDNNG